MPIFTRNALRAIISLFVFIDHDSLGIQPPHVRWLLGPPREASAIWAEKFHIDDVNLPRIQASLPNGYSTLKSRKIRKIFFVWITLVDIIKREWTADVFKLPFLVKKDSEAMPEFWTDWRHQYGMFWLESQTLISGDWGVTWREAAVLAGYDRADPCE